MVSGMGAREQPLLLIITTAGTDLASPCHDKHLEVQKVLRGHDRKRRVFAIIYASTRATTGRARRRSARQTRTWRSRSTRNSCLLSSGRRSLIRRTRIVSRRSTSTSGGRRRWPASTWPMEPAADHVAIAGAVRGQRSDFQPGPRIEARHLRFRKAIQARDGRGRRTYYAFGPH